MVVSLGIPLRAGVIRTSAAAAASVLIAGIAVAQEPRSEWPREPFQLAAEQEWAEGTLSAGVTFDVPSDRRLVIEQVSASHTVAIGQHLTRTFVVTTIGDRTTTHAVFVPRTGTTEGVLNVYNGGQHLRLYADPGTRVELGAARNDTNCPFPCGSMSMSVSGYLIPADSPSLAP
jgi:hypothetical protein